MNVKEGQKLTVGSYVVLIKDGPQNIPVGTIGKILSKPTNITFDVKFRNYEPRFVIIDFLGPVTGLDVLFDVMDNQP